MIREYVLENYIVTDLCCILNFMGMEVPNSVLKYCLTIHIMTSNTKCYKFYDERVEEKDKKWEKNDDWIYYGFFLEMHGTVG